MSDLSTKNLSGAVVNSPNKPVGKADTILHPTANKKLRVDPDSNDKKPEKHPEVPVQELPKQELPKEVGGPKGLEPTRYGDWESKGRCYDF